MAAGPSNRLVGHASPEVRDDSAAKTPVVDESVNLVQELPRSLSDARRTNFTTLENEYITDAFWRPTKKNSGLRSIVLRHEDKLELPKTIYYTRRYQMLMLL